MDAVTQLHWQDRLRRELGDTSEWDDIEKNISAFLTERPDAVQLMVWVILVIDIKITDAMTAVFHDPSETATKARARVEALKSLSSALLSAIPGESRGYIYESRRNAAGSSRAAGDLRR